MTATISMASDTIASLKRPLRLLYITDSVAMGGDTRSEAWLVSFFDKARFAITAVTPTYGPTYDYFKGIAGIEHVPIDLGALDAPERTLSSKVRSAAQFSQAMARITAIAARRRPDIVFVGDRSRAMIAGRASATVGGALLVYHPQYFYALGFKNAGLKKRTSLRADLVVSNSHFTTASYENIGVNRDKLCTAHNGIDTDHFTPGADNGAARRAGVPAASHILGIFSILRPFKGHDTLLAAMPRVIGAMPDTRLLVVGSGAERERLERVAADLGVAPHVTFAGFQSETLALFRAIDLYIMASVEEPFGLVTVEAMACEKPVVGTASGGTPEIIDDGKTGLLVPPEDPQRLADAIIKLLRDDARRSEMGKAARERVVANFTLRRRGAQVAVALERLVAESPRHRGR